MLSKILCIIFLATLAKNACGQLSGQLASSVKKASKTCYQHRHNRNDLDLYPFPDDCHYYYKCFYSGKDGSNAFGVKKRCRRGTYWRSDVFQCMPEGDQPCVDKCNNMKTGHCFGDSHNCANYYLCSWQTSYQFCCPENMAFNVSTCSCESSKMCYDACQRDSASAAARTPVKLPGSCIDAWGNKLQPTSLKHVFILVNQGDEEASKSVACTIGAEFDVDKCKCVGVDEDDDSEQDRRCFIYLPFDKKHDETAQNDNVQIDIVSPAAVSNKAAAHGSGSLRIVHPGRVEIARTKNKAQRIKALSNCLFLRCSKPPCRYTAGTIVENRGLSGSSHFNYILSMKSENVVRLQSACYNGTSFIPVTFQAPMPSMPEDARSGFTQICFMLTPVDDGRLYTGSLYINKQLVAKKTVDCHFSLTQYPITLGHDHEGGSTLRGFIDEFLECQYDIGQDGVDAHWNGREALTDAGMITAKP